MIQGEWPLAPRRELLNCVSKQRLLPNERRAVTRFVARWKSGRVVQLLILHEDR